MDSILSSSNVLSSRAVQYCVLCPSDTPSCPACATGEICVQVSETCTQCASRTCVKAASAGTIAPTPPHNNTGVIVGGVIGGVVLIGLATWLIWFFFLRHHRVPDNTALFDDEEDDDLRLEKSQRADYDRVGMAGRGRAASRGSLHTVHSLASSVLTRASNVIQIAFIPGITTASAAQPIPPIPIPTRTSTRTATPTYAHSLFARPSSPSRAPAHALIQPGTAGAQQDHYFLPGDLASTYSYDGAAGADGDDGASMTDAQTRHSLTSSLARASMTSTIYRDDAVAHPLPAQTALRARAAVITVPAVPQIPVEYSRYGQPIARQPDDAALVDLDDADHHPLAVSTSADSLHPAHRPSNMSLASTGTSIGILDEAVLYHMGGTGDMSMAAAIAEASRRAARPSFADMQLAAQRAREESPFGDEYAV